MAAANRVGVEHELYRVAIGDPVEGYGLSLLEADGHLLRLDRDALLPRGHAHDGLDDHDARVEALQVFRFVRGTQQIGIRRVRLLGAHAIREARALHVLRHLLASAQFVDEGLVEPRLVDAQAGIREQPVAIEPLDVVALVGAAVTPDIDVVFLHGGHEQRAGDGAAERRGVEVRHAGGGDVEGAALQGGNPLRDELSAAVHQARFFGAVLKRLAGNLVVVGLIRLPEVRGIRVGHRTLGAHPMQGRAGIETARECDADVFADGKGLEDGVSGHDDNPTIIAE